jgi:hypothetical protein
MSACVLTATGRTDLGVVGRGDKNRASRAVVVVMVALGAGDRGAWRLHGGGGSWACGDPGGVIFKRGPGRPDRG